MGQYISGLSNLLQMPYGCGEQNMITFVPNIFVIKYLTAIDNLKTEDENKAKGYMLAGKDPLIQTIYLVLKVISYSFCF